MMISYLIQSPLEYYARVTPDTPALSMQGEAMSYSNLDGAANQLAQALISNNVKPQQHVGIFLHKCLDLGVAIYGILKAGCVFVPLDPFTPAERLEFILQDCNIDHVTALKLNSDSRKHDGVILNSSRIQRRSLTLLIRILATSCTHRARRGFRKV